MKRFLFSFSLLLFFFFKGMAFNIYMTGDSHVCSNYYPERVGDILVDADPEIDFSYWGKVGATFETFNTTPPYMDKIYDAAPDILIVHLGTNDSYSDPFKKDWFVDNLNTFYENVKSGCPDCMIVFITPFYNKLKNGKVNGSTRECADAYIDFGADHDDVFIVDNNADYGMYFLDGGAELIRNDGVHLTMEGYKDLGDQVGQEIIDIDALWVDAE